MNIGGISWTPGTWPRGRRNGLRVVGIDWRLIVDFTTWALVPFKMRHGAACWLCFRLFLHWNYDLFEEPTP